VRRVGEAVSRHTSIWSLSSEVVDAIVATVNCKYALIYAGPGLALHELQAVSSIFSGSEQFPMALRCTRLTRRLDQTAGPIQIANVAECDLCSEDWPFPKNLVSWLFIPLTRTQSRGVLCLADDAPAAFDERTLRVLITVVPQISNAFSNIGLYNELRESESKYRTLVARMQDGVCICSRTWQIVEANPAAENLFGGPIAGRSLTELFASPNAAGEFIEAVRKSRALQNFEAHLLTAANQRFIALLSCVSDGDFYFGVIKDMREQSRRTDQTPTNQPRRSAARRLARPANGSEKILIADDEPEILELIESSLSNLGYSVVCARDGIEAVEHAEGDVKLIVLDMIMPKMDGVAALRRIREKMPQVKVIITSGYSSPEKAPLLEELGISHFVQKPFELRKLACVIRDVLDGVAV
jgi:CheY-like chemotaxis protein